MNEISTKLSFSFNDYQKNSESLPKFKPQTVEKQNLVKNQYLSATPSYLVSIDITNIDKHGSLLTAMDMASRAILGHYYKEGTINSSEAVFTLRRIVQDRSFLPEIKILHSDSDSRFKSELMGDFLNEFHILPSETIGQKNQNQAHEAMHRTLKNTLRTILDPSFSANSQTQYLKHYDPLRQTPEELGPLGQKVFQSIEQYNDHSHRGLQGLSPNLMEEALYKHWSHQFKEVGAQSLTLLPLVQNNASFEAKKVRHIQYDAAADLLKEYQGEIERLKAENLGLVKEKQQIVTYTSAICYNLLLENREMKKQQAETNNFIQQEIVEKKAAQIRKQQRLSRKRRPTLDVIGKGEFEDLYKSVKGQGYAPARIRCFFLTAYFTGLRINEFLSLTVKQMKNLAANRAIKLSLSKRGPAKHPVSICSTAAKRIKASWNAFDYLMKGKQDNDPFFTTGKQLHKPINLNQFTTEVNKVLKSKGKLIGKNWTSHSFRHTFITDLNDLYGLNDTRLYIGHKDVGTTAQYTRKVLTPDEIEKMNEALVKHREQRSNI